MARRIAIVVVLVSLVLPVPAAAQTLGDALRSIDEAVARSEFAQREPVLQAELEGHLASLRQSGFADWPVEEIAAALAERPRLANVARLDSGLAPRREALARVRMLDTPLTMAGAIVDNELTLTLQARVGAGETARLLQPWTALYRALLSQSIEESLEKLRRYERKFGPGSARLNGIEVLGNYGLQNVRYFGPDAQGWPGPLELITAYSPSYMTIADGSGRFVSVGEFGLRRYFFGESWGGGGILGFVKPAFTTFGMAVAGERDGPLRWPWQGEPRVGVFMSWGEVKVAYVHGDEQRLLVTRQFHLIPWVF